MIRVTPLKFEVTALPEDFKEGALWVLTVEYRKPELYVIKRTVSVYSKTDEWDYEPIVDERSDEWLEQHLFPLDEALELAKWLASKVRVHTEFGRLTAMDALERLG
jgi:hypothetical protein